MTKMTSDNVQNHGYNSQFCTSSSSTWPPTSLGKSISRTFKRFSSTSPNPSTPWGLLSSTLTRRLLGQFFIKWIRRSKFFTPRWHRWRLIRIPTIKNTLYVSIWLPCMFQISLAKYARIGNCPSCFDHQRRGFWVESNGTSNVWNQENSHWTKITYIISKLVTCAKWKMQTQTKYI